MAVTELALLYFKDDENPSVKEGLAQAQQAQEEHSKHKVQFLRQVEDPSYFYLLAGWESLETHISHSAHYQGKLTQLTDRVGVDWMFHLDADVSSLTFCFLSFI
jgi:hypothetical protein